MAREVERKFLVHPVGFLRWVLTQPSPVRIETISQHYLTAGDPEIRIRFGEGPPQMCFKYPTDDPVERDEFEFEIPAAAANQLSSKTRLLLVLERFHVVWGTKKWAVDHVDRHPRLGSVWVAEIELTDHEEAFERPPWLDEEVTHDPKYRSAALAWVV